MSVISAEDPLVAEAEAIKQSRGGTDFVVVKEVFRLHGIYKPERFREVLHALQRKRSAPIQYHREVSFKMKAANDSDD